MPQIIEVVDRDIKTDTIPYVQEDRGKIEHVKSIYERLKDPH